MKLIKQDKSLKDIIINIFTSCHGHGRRRAAVFHFKFGLPQKKENIPMPTTVEITNEQKVKVTLAPVTDTGKPAKLDGSPSWAVITGNSQVVVADDGLSADLISSDDPGDTQVLIKADANLGEGVEEISDTITLTVIGATAKNLGVTVGAPEPK
jgi:hypothetical protein